MRAALEYLPGDLFGLGDLERRALSADPTIDDLPGLLVPRRIESIPTPIDAFDSDERAELSANWEANLTSFEPHVAVLESVRKLSTPGCSVILVQAPPHFCGGPLEVVYRSLHAIRLARTLTERFANPVVPVLWNDSDGHELEAVRNLELLNDNFNLRRVSPASLGSNRHPISRILLKDELHRLPPLREFLRQDLSECAFLEELLETAFPRPGESLETAFTRWILSIFGPLGLIVLQPDWIRVGLSRALADLVLLDPARDLQTAESDDPALIYRIADNRREPLRRGGEGFQYDEEVGSRTVSEMAAVIVQDPPSWSPGELLLPLVQEAVLPVAAHIGSWQQWKRFVPTAPLRVRAELPSAVFVPAQRATLIDPDCANVLNRNSIDLAEILKPTEAGKTESANDESAPIAMRMREMSKRAAKELRSLRAELAELDRGLSIQLKRTARSMQELVEELAKRVDRSFQNHGGQEDRKTRRLRNSLLPRDLPQEVVLSSLPIFARHGWDWLVPLLEQLDDLPTEHLVIRLEESEAST